MQQRQAYLRNGKGGGDIDVHDLLPHRGIVLLNAVALTEDAGVVNETVEPAEFPGQAICERRVGVTARDGQVHHGNRRARRAGQSLDLVIHCFELGYVAAVQDDLCAVPGGVDGERSADAVAGARDEDNASLVRRSPG